MPFRQRSPLRVYNPLSLIAVVLVIILVAELIILLIGLAVGLVGLAVIAVGIPVVVMVLIVVIRHLNTPPFCMLIFPHYTRFMRRYEISDKNFFIF